MAENTNKGGFQSKPAPKDICEGAKNRTAEFKGGEQGAGEVGNSAKNPYGPDKQG
tara:strand:+ start:1126 stop:1290 length:165 start_codon:yes stop_codon:yes gene_type:complete